MLLLAAMLEGCFVMASFRFLKLLLKHFSWVFVHVSYIPIYSAIFAGLFFTPSVGKLSSGAQRKFQGTQKSRMVSSKDNRMMAKSKIFHHFSLPQKKWLIPFANKPESRLLEKSPAAGKISQNAVFEFQKVLVKEKKTQNAFFELQKILVKEQSSQYACCI